MPYLIVIVWFGIIMVCVVLNLAYFAMGRPIDSLSAERRAASFSDGLQLMRLRYVRGLLLLLLYTGVLLLIASTVLLLLFFHLL